MYTSPHNFGRGTARSFATIGLFGTVVADAVNFFSAAVLWGMIRSSQRSWPLRDHHPDQHPFLVEKGQDRHSHVGDVRRALLARLAIAIGSFSFLRDRRYFENGDFAAGAGAMGGAAVGAGAGGGLVLPSGLTP